MGEPWAPLKLYYVLWSRAVWWPATRLRAARPEVAVQARALEAPPLDGSLPDHQGVVGDHWEQGRNALIAHATQVDPNSLFWFGLPPEVDRDAYPYDDYILARSAVPTKLPEDDLFAGIEDGAVG